VAVSEDVDPSNADAVFWSMAYRSNPIEDVQLIPNRSPGHGPNSDHAGAAGTGRRGNSTMLVDATLKHVMPPVALPAREYMEKAVERWKALGLPALSLRAPWHGYTLGDWSDSWEAFARNAVAGDWEENGTETFARRRAGITPETPVRAVERPDKPGKL
jgi:4-hydroxy-3-polyprenylbenzoate decarboxylase